MDSRKAGARLRSKSQSKSFLTNFTAATLVFIAVLNSYSYSNSGTNNQSKFLVEARRSGGGGSSSRSGGGGRVPPPSRRGSSGSSGNRNRNKSQVANKRRRSPSSSYYDDEDVEDANGQDEETEMNFGFLDDDIDDDEDNAAGGYDEDYEEEEPVRSRGRGGGRPTRAAQGRGRGGQSQGQGPGGRKPQPQPTGRRSRYEQDYDEDMYDDDEEMYQPQPRKSQSQSSSRRRGGSGSRSRSGNVVPYGANSRGRRAQPQPSAFTRGLATLRNSIPDPNTFKDTALNSISAARETTTKLTSNIYREVKGLTSSELEQVMLKATSPNDVPVKGKHVERLVGVTYQISGRYDIYDAVLRKLWSKMVEKDWRTTVKALYILHRFSADGAPDHQAALKARLRELRRTRDPKRGKEKYFNSKQLLSGDTSVSESVQRFQRF